MKKIENIIDNCKDCKFCLRFNPPEQWMDPAFICGKTSHLLGIGPVIEDVAIPDWCPLETYKEVEKSETRSTIILPGMPGLEWMTENLSGFGGTEIDGRWYYTYEEAEEAVKQLGNGWRLPIDDEFVQLDELGSVWVEDGPHGLPGRLFGGGLFLDAAGYRATSTGALLSVGDGGWCWSSSSYSAGNRCAGSLGFGTSSVYPLNHVDRAFGFVVRCVRNVK